MVNPKTLQRDAELMQFVEVERVDFADAPQSVGERRTLARCLEKLHQQEDVRQVPDALTFFGALMLNRVGRG